MGLRIGTETAAVFIANIEAELKKYTKKDLTELSIINIINRKVNTIHALLGTTDKALYKDTAILNAGQSTHEGGIVDLSQEQAYTNATRLVTIPVAVFTGGSFSTNITDATKIPIGSQVVFYLAQGGANVFITEVEEIKSTSTFTVKTAYGQNLTQADFRIAVIIPSQTDDIQISSAAWYPLLDQILGVYDSGLVDECVNCITINNFWGIKKRNLSYNYKKAIIFVRDGEYIRFKRGSEVAAYGTRTLHMTRMPMDLTEETDIIDIPKANLDLLYKLVKLECLQTIRVPIPEELASAYAELEKMKTAKDKEIIDLINGNPDN